MGGNITFKGRLKALLYAPLFLLLVMGPLNAVVYFFSIKAGACITLFLGLYVLLYLILLRVNRKTLSDEQLRFSEYDSVIQRGFLENLEVPFALLEDDGRIIWMNRMFREVFGKRETYHKSIAGIFPALSRESLMKIDRQGQFSIDYEGRQLVAELKKQLVPSYEGKGLQIGNGKEREAISLLLRDETKYVSLLKEYQQEQVGVALVYIDNYEDVTESIDSVEASMLLARIDRKVSSYFSGRNIILKKFDRDKYLVVFKQKFLDQCQENQFKIMEDVKLVHEGNHAGVTLSVGIGVGGKDYEENNEFAKSAVDIALGRGGDQVVIRENEKVTYYGNSKRKVEKVSRVKARIKAQALREIMEGCEDVMVMGHQIGDVDSFGASVGIYHAASMLGKPVHIVLDQVTSSIRPLKERFSVDNGYPADMFYSTEEAVDQADRDTLVMVVDVNRPSYTECPELLHCGGTVVVFDHHRHGKEIIDNAVLSYIEPYASSTCEMITEVLQYFSDDVQLNPEEADSIYAGIVIDTNNFTTKTGVRTFEAAAALRRAGADVTRVRKLMQNDMAGYKARAEAVRRAQVYRGCFAISTCPAEDVESPTVSGAQAANELLNIIGIKASFVLTPYQGKIYISGRSIDEIDVQSIMEDLGGGGHRNVAGAQVEGEDEEEVISQIKEILDRRIEKGDIKL